MNIKLALSTFPALLFSNPILGACTYPGGSQASSANFIDNLPNSISVSSGLPINSEIYTGSMILISNTTATCGNSNNTLYFSMLSSPSLGNAVYPTSLPGVGVSISHLGVNLANPAVSRVINFNPLLNAPLTPQLRLIKTGDITVGELKPKNSGIWGQTNINTSGVPLFSYLNFTPVTIQKSSCNVIQSAIQVPMGIIHKSHFSGVGSTVAERTFTINIECDGLTEVLLKMDGMADSSNAPGVLALNTSVTPVASGVGIQILYGDTPLTLNQHNSLGEYNIGQDDIELTARYYQTQSLITGGSANSAANFTLTYQ